MDISMDIQEKFVDMDMDVNIISTATMGMSKENAGSCSM
jgi:hypothetical protein